MKTVCLSDDEDDRMFRRWRDEVRETMVTRVFKTADPSRFGCTLKHVHCLMRHFSNRTWVWLEVCFSCRRRSVGSVRFWFWVWMALGRAACSRVWPPGSWRPRRVGAAQPAGSTSSAWTPPPVSWTSWRVRPHPRLIRANRTGLCGS